MSDTVIQITNLCREFDGVPAVDGISLEISRGEVFGFVGPDGSGKTTTFRMISGVMKPTSGTLMVDGNDMVADPESVKLGVGYMPQTFGLYGDLTVVENLEFYADLYSVPPDIRPERLEKLLAFARLQPFKTRLARNLSGGMKQKLALAATLMSDPSVLLLDEPTTGVDPVSRRDFWRILYELNKQGVTLVVSTPYMDEAERCTRVALMFGGKVVAVDTPDRIRGLMVGDLLILDTPDERRARTIISGMDGVISVELFGAKVHVVVANADATAEKLRERLSAEGVPVTKMEKAVPNLEDVFVSLLRSPGTQDEE